MGRQRMEPRKLTKGLVIASDASRVLRVFSAALASEHARFGDGYGWVLGFCPTEAASHLMRVWLHRMQVESSVSTSPAGGVPKRRDEDH
jgi:hypothetical protein